MSDATERTAEEGDEPDAATDADEPDATTGERDESDGPTGDGVGEPAADSAERASERDEEYDPAVGTAGGGSSGTTAASGATGSGTMASETLDSGTTSTVGAEAAVDIGDERTAVDARDRWQVGLLFALTAGAAGIALSNTGAFLAAIVGLVYAGYCSLSSPPGPPLVVERSVAPAAPRPGDRLTVTVSAENVGEAPLADVRLADAPPADLELLAGEVRHAATVEAGETVTYSYELRAGRGKHAFGDVVAVLRGASGEGVRRTTYDAAQSVVCHAPFESLDLAGQTGIAAGRVETDSGGEGVEFYATREYARGDPASRVDWNRYASTGELTTVTYRESKAATVVFVVDGRFDGRRAAGEPTAAALCGYATVRIGDALLDSQNRVGAAVLTAVNHGMTRTRGAVRPGTGTEQSVRIRALLRTRVGVEVDDVDATVTRSSASALGDRTGGSGAGSRGSGSGSPASSRTTVRRRRLSDELPAGAQVVFVSPLLDDDAVDVVDGLVARGHATTVVTPDVTGTSTPGGTIEHVRRAARLRDVQGGERVRLVDWSPDEPLQVAVDRASARWDG